MRTRLRVQAPDLVYHVASRAVDKQRIFGIVDGDRHVFLALLAKTVERCGWVVHAYCVMGNHFHLVLETPHANLAAGMQYLKSSYAMWFNELRPREGALINPVRAGLCAHPADWSWSSYRATAGIVHEPPFLTTSFIYDLFGGGDLGRRRYAEFVVAALDRPGVSSRRVLAQSQATARTA